MAKQIDMASEQRRLEREVLKARDTNEQAMRDIARALERVIQTQDDLRAAEANFNRFMSSRLSDALADMQRLRLPAAE